MVKTKQKGIAKWLCLAVFALCISLCLAMATTNTAYAATTPKYTLAYDYTHYYNYNTSKSADGSGTGVLSASVKGDNGSMTTVKFYILRFFHFGHGESIQRRSDSKQLAYNYA